MENVEIHLLQPEDWLSWKQIRLEALKNHPEAFGSSYEEEILFADDQFKNNLMNTDIFGAFIGNNLVGTAGFFKFKFAKMQHRGSLYAMYVCPSQRRKGISQYLLNTIINYAKERVTQLHCHVTTHNQFAADLYLKNGFRVYGTEPCALKVNDTFYDEYLMVLTFI